MQQSHLNGDLTSKFYALGIEGTPFFRYADTFKDSLERTLELGIEVSNFFATPKLNHDQSYIDFYIPFAPKGINNQYEVIPYSQMSDDEKDKVKKDLKILEQKFLKVANNIRSRSLQGDEALFATLLLGDKEDRFPTLSYPSNDYVFLVDNQVVLTFWGFVQYERKEHKSKHLDKNINNTNLKTAAVSTATEIKPIEDVKFKENVVKEETIIRTTSKEEQKKEVLGFCTCERHKGCLRWLLALLLLLLLLALLWWLLTRFLGNPFSFPSFGMDDGVKQEMLLDDKKDEIKEDPLHEDKVTRDGLDVSVTSQKLNGNSLDGSSLNGVDLNNNTLASDSSKGINDNISTSNTDNIQNNPNNKNLDPIDIPSLSNDGKDTNQNIDPNNQDLLKDYDNKDNVKSTNVDPVDLNNKKDGQNKSNNLDLDKLKNNDISVIDGKWGTRSGIMDASTGKPLNMEYNFKNGKGDITVTRLDGSKCTTKAISSVANGQLQISPQGKAICPDNSTYSIPEVKCHVNSQDKAKCNGIYEGKEDFPLHMFSK